MPAPGQTPMMGAGTPAPTAAAPPSSTYQDLSLDMDPHWQMIDWAHRQFKKALRTQGFHREGEAKAQLVEYVNGIDRLIQRYAYKKKPDLNTMAPPTSSGDDIDLENTDDASAEDAGVNE